jgi:hypothetical protein
VASPLLEMLINQIMRPHTSFVSVQRGVVRPVRFTQSRLQLAPLLVRGDRNR